MRKILALARFTPKQRKLCAVILFTLTSLLVGTKHRRLGPQWIEEEGMWLKNNGSLLGDCDLSIFICRRNSIAAFKLKRKNKMVKAQKRADFLSENADKIAAKREELLSLQKLEERRVFQEDHEHVGRLRAKSKEHAEEVQRAMGRARSFSLSSLSSTVVRTDLGGIADLKAQVEKAEADAANSHRAFRWAYRQHRARNSEKGYEPYENGVIIPAEKGYEP
mmetsp:Transcript_25306/g.51991  ORF Transcript_25306/g.51991 Transcript_25306/m.51991 type:complete len:221 (+) Transcript_25306:96-758(+)